MWHGWQSLSFVDCSPLPSPSSDIWLVEFSIACISASISHAKQIAPYPFSLPPPPPLFWQLIFVFQIFFYSRYCLAQYCQCTLIFFWFSLTKFVGAAVFSGPSTTPYLYPVLLTTDPNHQALHKQFGDASEPSLFVALCSNCVCALLEELAEFAAHPLPLAPAAGCFTPFCIGY